MSGLITETKKLIEKIPTDRLSMAKSFLMWLSDEEYISEKEFKKILKGEKEIAQGDCISWRKVARTL